MQGFPMDINSGMESLGHRVYTASTCLSANYCNNLHSQKWYVSVPVYLSKIYYFQILILIYVIYLHLLLIQQISFWKPLSKKKVWWMNTSITPQMYKQALKSGRCTSICVMKSMFRKEFSICIYEMLASELLITTRERVLVPTLFLSIFCIPEELTT